MLTFPGANSLRFCGGFSRRNFLKVGTLGLGGLSLADLLQPANSAKCRKCALTPNTEHPC